MIASFSNVLPKLAAKLASVMGRAKGPAKKWRWTQNEKKKYVLIPLTMAFNAWLVSCDIEPDYQPQRPYSTSKATLAATSGSVDASAVVSGASPLTCFKFFNRCVDAKLGPKFFRTVAEKVLRTVFHYFFITFSLGKEWP